MGTVQTAVGVVREVRDGVEASRPVLVCGRPGPAAKARAALLEGGGDENLVQAFALRRLRAEDSERLAEAAVVIYAGEVVTSLDQETRDDLDVVAACGRPVVVVLEGLDIPGEVLTRCRSAAGDHSGGRDRIARRAVSRPTLAGHGG